MTGKKSVAKKKLRDVQNLIFYTHELDTVAKLIAFALDAKNIKERITMMSEKSAVLAQRALLDVQYSRLSRRSADLILALEDQIGDVSMWPVHMYKLILLRHLNHTERFTLTLFLLANRCSPVMIATWMTNRRVLRDLSARRHVASLLRAHQLGELERKGYTTFIMDMTLDNGDPAPFHMKFCIVYTPSFAKIPVHSCYWETAIKMLL